MVIGPWTVDWVDFGTFKLDGGAMFGVVPKTLWSALIPGDGQNRIELGLWGLVLRSPDRCVLVDSGVWSGFGEKLRKAYAIAPGAGDRGTLESLDPDSVTDVVLSHLHFDHAGGSILPTEAGPRPAFPNARYHTSRTQLDWAIRPSLRDRASYATEMVLAIRDLPQLLTYDDKTDLGAGVTLNEVGGHTPGMTLLLVQDDDGGLLHTADMTPTSSHAPLPYVMAYDLEPVETVKARQRWYAEAAYRGWMLFFQHDPDHPLWTIRKDDKGRYQRDQRIDVR